VVKEDKFKLIYAQFFPRGAETNGYARFVFNSFDVQKKQEITFTDFVIGLSVLTRGTIDEQLRWIFTLYDLNGDGMITRDELSKIVSSVHDLMGRFALSSQAAAAATAAANLRPAVNEGPNRGPQADSAEPAGGKLAHAIQPADLERSPAGDGGAVPQAAPPAPLTSEEQAENLFRKFDLNNDGVITLDEFIEACHKVSTRSSCCCCCAARRHALLAPVGPAAGASNQIKRLTITAGRFRAPTHTQPSPASDNTTTTTPHTAHPPRTGREHNQINFCFQYGPLADKRRGLRAPGRRQHERRPSSGRLTGGAAGKRANTNANTDSRAQTHVVPGRCSRRRRSLIQIYDLIIFVLARKQTDRQTDTRSHNNDDGAPVQSLEDIPPRSAPRRPDERAAGERRAASA
jgi:Ca2+-binding EF-hand superfamily protein